MLKRDASPRRRYARSSTTSVTQLLSDSCSSLIHRLTNKVRGPSQTSDPNILRTKNHVDVYSDIPLRHEADKSKLELDKRNKTDHIKIKRNRTEGLKSDYKNFFTGLKDGGIHSNLELGNDENLVEKRIGEVNKEIENCQKEYNQEPKIIKRDEEKPVKGRFLEDLSLNSLGATRMRLEDKYSDALNKVVKRKRDLQKALSPIEPRLELTKSATTASILLSEKAYPFVSSPVLAPRAKTPYRVGELRHRGHHLKSYKGELQPTYRKSGPLRTDGNGYLHEISSKPYLKICSIDIDKDGERSSKAKTPKQTVKKLKEACGADDAVSEREVRRKEIQSLINKYAMLDEAYNRLNAKAKMKSKTREATVKHSASTQTVNRLKVAGVSRWCGVCSVQILTHTNWNATAVSLEKYGLREM